MKTIFISEAAMHKDLFYAGTLETTTEMDRVTIQRKERMGPELPPLLTPWRLKWYPRALLFAFALAFLTTIFSGKGVSTLTGRLGGDYPAFYGAGRIIADGDWENLYNAQKQWESQRKLYPEDEKGFLAFVYPPYIAVAYYPLSLMDYRLSYTIHTFLMAGAFLLAILLLRPVNRQVRDNYWFVASLALWFYPIFRAILGGQNTTLTFLLIVGAWRAVLSGRELVGGILLGLLLFKPQFALPVIGLFLISSRWRVVTGSVCVSMLLYAIGTYVLGPHWIAHWLKFAGWSAQVDAGLNRANAVCWLGFFQAILGPDSRFAFVIGWGMVFMTAIALVFIWWAGRRNGDVTARLAITATALVLLPPHVMYYDVSLILFTWFAMVETYRGSSWLLLLSLWILGISQLLGAAAGFSPLFLITLFTLIFSMWVLGQATMEQHLYNPRQVKV